MAKGGEKYGAGRPWLEDESGAKPTAGHSQNASGRGAAGLVCRWPVLDRRLFGQAMREHQVQVRARLIDLELFDRWRAPHATGANCTLALPFRRGTQVVHLPSTGRTCGHAVNAG